MKVYRVQINHTSSPGPAGVGPYHFRGRSWDYITDDQMCVLTAMIDKHQGTDHPEPTEDGIHSCDVGFCGFFSLKDLHDWFEGFLKDLIQVGFEVWEHEVTQVHSGRKQVCFDECDIVSSKKLKYQQIFK